VVVLSPPELLIAFRAGCAPLIFALACFGFPGPLLALVLVAAFLSDVFDGVIARRLGLATAGVRRADTLVDTFFYVAAAAALKVAVPRAFDNSELALVSLVIVHVSRATFELSKYGRLSSYHMWSSKLLGILLVIAMLQAFITGQPAAILPIAIWFGVVNEIEGFAISAVLPAWRTDVPSIVHALHYPQREAA
jgi:CDP-diacylglycerol--glycerol-3-phosphate 3-phosphatidyltransferase